MTDFKEYIERAKQGDHAAFELVYNELYTPVFRYTLSRVKHRQTAEDIVSEVFLKFYSSLENFELVHDTPLSFLYTISKNLIINHGKKKKSLLFEEGAEYEVEDERKNQLQESLEKEDVQMILDVLGELEETQAEVIRLKFLSELTTREVAEALQKTEVNIRQLESRALRKIRELVQKKYE